MNFLMLHTSVKTVTKSYAFFVKAHTRWCKVFWVLATSVCFHWFFFWCIHAFKLNKHVWVLVWNHIWDARFLDVNYRFCVVLKNFIYIRAFQNVVNTWFCCCITISKCCESFKKCFATIFCCIAFLKCCNYFAWL
jgi:hypothetical protein